MLCRMLLANLQADETAVYIPNPHLMPTMLRVAVARELGLTADSQLDQNLLLGRIQERLIELAREGRRVVVCLDEAQAMPDETLEALRLLTNLETEKRKLLQVVLFGQPELEEKLAKPALRQVRQRIAWSYRLGPYARDDIESYVGHRLTVAGYDGPALFRGRTIDELERATGGIPRLINIVSHKALLLTYGRGGTRVRPTDVRAAAQDTDGALQDYTVQNFAEEASSPEVLWAIQNTQEDSEEGVRGSYDVENSTPLGINPSYVNTWFLDSSDGDVTSGELASSNDDRLTGRGSEGDDDYVRPLYIVDGGVPFTEKWGIRFMDVPVLRLAEMFLIRGETTLQGATGGPPAVQDLNVVRQRSGLTALNSATVDDFVAERARELAHENDYLHNLMRLERSIDGQSYSDVLNQVTFPIPESETLNNPDVAQNPGYPRTGS